MIQTSNESSVVTLINVFTVDPADQQRLVDLLTRATDGFVSSAPGFISAALHRSIDGTKVTIYAQWRSAEDYQAMRQDSGPRPFLEEALTIAKSPIAIQANIRSGSALGQLRSSIDASVTFQPVISDRKSGGRYHKRY